MKGRDRPDEFAPTERVGKCPRIAQLVQPISGADEVVCREDVLGSVRNHAASPIVPRLSANYRNRVRILPKHASQSSYRHQPNCISVESNASFGLDPISVSYDPTFDRHEKHPSGWYHGASLTALAKLCASIGYGLAAISEGGANASFTRTGNLDPTTSWRPNALRDGGQAKAHSSSSSQSWECHWLKTKKFNWRALLRRADDFESYYRFMSFYFYARLLERPPAGAFFNLI